MSPTAGASLARYRIGPFTLAARGHFPLVAVPSPDPSDGPLSDFVETDSSIAAADMTLEVEQGEPPNRPESPPLFLHRAGWDLHRSDTGDGRLLAIKAIPHGTDRIVRVATIDADLRHARLRVSPLDDRPDRPFAYTLAELLVLLLARSREALLVHAACVETPTGEAMLFAGVSGSGKSTMAEIWSRSAPADHVVLGDESHLVWRDSRGRFLVGGTPWPGSSGLYANRTARLARIYFIEHGKRHALRSLDSPAESMTTLLSHSFLSNWDAESAAVAAGLAADLARDIPMARLAFTPDESVVPYLTRAAS